MKRIALIAVATTALGLLSGCNITPSYDQRYDPENHSRAYNLAQAGNLWKASDREVDQSDYTAAMTNVSDAFGTTLLVNSNFGLGLDWGASLGVGLIDFLISPPDQLQRDSAFFFVPTAEAATGDEARALVFDYYRKAVKQAASDLEMEAQQRGDDDDHEGSWNREGVGFVLANESLGCPGYDVPVETTQDRCMAVLKISPKKRYEAMAPLATGLAEPVFFFQNNGHKRDSPFYVILPETAKITQEVIAAKISAHMPRWFYVYLAPDKERKRPAMVFEQGQANLFLVPKS